MHLCSWLSGRNTMCLTSGWSGHRYGGMALAWGKSNGPASSRRLATPLGHRWALRR